MIAAIDLDAVLPLAALAALAAVPVLVPTVVLLFLPWPLTRYVLIPLGLPRSSFVVTHLALLTWAGQTRRGAIVAAAWAALRSKRDERDLLDWLESLLARRTPLGVQEVTAYGLIAVKRGHLDDARSLLSSADELAKNHGPTLAGAIAAEWVTADAAARGDWERVYEVAHADAVRTRATRLVGDVAGRLTGRDEAPPWRLWLRWLVAPHRIHTHALVRRALDQAPGSATRVVPDAVVLPQADDPFLAALTLHAALLERPSTALLAEDLVRLARAWDEAFDDPATAQGIADRANALGSPASDRALTQLMDDVEQDLVALARTADLAPPGPMVASRTLQGALKKLRADALAELELAADLLEHRVDEKRALPAVDEWRDWQKLRHQAEAAFRVGDPKLKRLVFAALHGPVCALAVWLFNDRHERHAAHAIFSWLLEKAEEVDDVDAIRLQQGNVTASGRWI